MAITLVQSNTANAASLTLASATTAGNTLVVGCTDEAGASSVSAATLGGAAGNFAQLVLAAANVAGSEIMGTFWADPNCSGGQTSVAVTASGHGTGITICAMEFSGLLATSTLATMTDQTKTATGTAGSWTTGNSAGTPVAGALWLGVMADQAASGTAASTSPAWNTITAGDGAGDNMLYAWKIVPSPGGAAVFNGTGGSSKGWATAVATLKPGSGVMPSNSMHLNQAVMRSAVW